MDKFSEEVAGRIKKNGSNEALQNSAHEFMLKSINTMYSYNFSWMGRPIIQYPQDIVGIQELIWTVKPDLIIETGIAHGGSLILSASMLALLELCEATESGTSIDPNKPARKVLGVDIDIREHNRKAIEEHPLSARIDMIQGSSVAPDVMEQVRSIAANYSKILVCLDSNHTHDHVLAELQEYAPLVTKGSYCVVYDSIVEDLPAGSCADRPWDKGNNPKTAAWEYLKSHPEFELDRSVQDKLLLTVAPDGYLKRVSE